MWKRFLLAREVHITTAGDGRSHLGSIHFHLDISAAGHTQFQFIGANNFIFTHNISRPVRFDAAVFRCGDIYFDGTPGLQPVSVFGINLQDITIHVSFYIGENIFFSLYPDAV